MFFSVVFKAGNPGKVYQICDVMFRWRRCRPWAATHPPFALDRSELFRQIRELVDRESSKFLSGDARMTAEIIYLRPVCRVNFELLEQFEHRAST